MNPPRDYAEDIGRLTANQENLVERFDRFEERVTGEQRKVHEIIDAMSDSTRIVARKVDLIEPLAIAYQNELAERRGRNKFLWAVYATIAAIAGVVASHLPEWWPKIFGGGRP